MITSLISGFARRETCCHGPFALRCPSRSMIVIRCLLALA
jgi:hypothetical protein